ncbi:MAG: hypothetical protein JWO66_2579 [Candidatus Eremiobacteraeota bacterium]|nr:hypothetical protein [Candidatus Eremiobacteraeota bacterium]
MLPIDAANDDPTRLREEVAHLRLRVAALEAERDEFAQQNAELFVLQQVFSTMNSTLEIDDILATVLRGVFETLAFRRVVLFDVRDGVAGRRLETQLDGAVIPSADQAAMRLSPSFVAMVAGTSEFALGSAEDDESPLADAQGSYCMLPLVSRDTVRGILYVDTPVGPDVGETQLRMLLDFAAQAAIAMENARLYGETKRLLEQTQSLASTDPLTGLANRRALTEIMERELHNAERHRAPLALVVLDLDDLKKINDAQGHQAGDDALKTFAEILRSAPRKGDLTARYGGDEFVLLMTQSDRTAAEAVLGRLYDALPATGLTCSAGVAIFPRNGADATALFEAADRALYEAKQAGKDGFRFAPDPA